MVAIDDAAGRRISNGIAMRSLSDTSGGYRSGGGHATSLARRVGVNRDVTRPTISLWAPSAPSVLPHRPPGWAPLPSRGPVSHFMLEDGAERDEILAVLSTGAQVRTAV